MSYIDFTKNIYVCRPANQELLFGFENSLKIQGGGGDRHVSTDNTSWESFIKESECKKVKVSQATDYYYLLLSITVYLQFIFLLFLSY